MIQHLISANSFFCCKQKCTRGWFVTWWVVLMPGSHWSIWIARGYFIHSSLTVNKPARREAVGYSSIVLVTECSQLQQPPTPMTYCRLTIRLNPLNQWSHRAELKTFLLGVWVIVIRIIVAEQGSSYATDSAAPIFKSFHTVITKDLKIYLPSMKKSVQ